MRISDWSSDVCSSDLSTSDAIVGQQYVTREIAKERVVKKLTLDTIIATQEPGEIHFLKIDVEVAEAEVLKGLSLNHNRPWIIVLESLEDRKSLVSGKSVSVRVALEGRRSITLEEINEIYD